MSPDVTFRGDRFEGGPQWDLPASSVPSSFQVHFNRGVAGSQRFARLSFGTRELGEPSQGCQLMDICEVGVRTGTASHSQDQFVKLDTVWTNQCLYLLIFWNGHSLGIHLIALSY